MTSVQVLIGVKIYTHDIRVFWARRSPTGTGMNIQETTDKFDAQTPTNATLMIPKAFIFWGVPAANMPPTPTQNLVLYLETLRLAIADLM